MGKANPADEMLSNEVSQMWNEPRHSKQEMPEGKATISLYSSWQYLRKESNCFLVEAAKIKAAMSGFTLPPSAQPDWAKSLNEEEWKQTLYDKLKISKNAESSADSAPNDWL